MIQQYLSSMSANPSSLTHPALVSLLDSLSLITPTINRHLRLIRHLDSTSNSLHMQLISQSSLIHQLHGIHQNQSYLRNAPQDASQISQRRSKIFISCLVIQMRMQAIVKQKIEISKQLHEQITQGLHLIRKTRYQKQKKKQQKQRQDNADEIQTSSSSDRHSKSMLKARDGEQCARQEENQKNKKPEENHEQFCICRCEPFGCMVQCDNPKCGVQWFHLKCVGIQRKKNIPTQWLCPACK